jgi:hypothetical protein
MEEDFERCKDGYNNTNVNKEGEVFPWETIY